MSEDVSARILLGVRGMTSAESRTRVHEALRGLPGVHGVEAGDTEQVEVRYDPTEATVMDMIRALRHLGFLAGME